MRSRFFHICFQFCLLFILWGQGSSKGFASSSACYLFYEVKVLPKDLLPLLLVIYSMRSKFFQRICLQFCLLFILWCQGSSKYLLPLLLVIYSIRSRFLQRICFNFCLLFILWGQGSSKGFASNLLVIYSIRSRFLQRICFQFCLLFILWGQGSSKGFASSSACYLSLLFILWGQGSSKGFASISACYLFYEVKVLPKDLLPVLLVIYSMRSKFFQRICFQFCLLFILWGQGSFKGFASSSACYLFYEVEVLPNELLPFLLVIYSMRSRFFQKICFQFCLLFILWGKGSSKGFASSSAGYLFYEVRVLPKDLLPVLLVIYSMR